MSYSIFVYGTLRPDLLVPGKSPPRLAYVFQGCAYKKAWIKVQGKLITNEELNYPLLVQDTHINVIPGNLIALPETYEYYNILKEVNDIEVSAGYYLIPIIAYTSENKHYTFTYWSDVELKNPITIKDYKEYLYGQHSA